MAADGQSGARRRRRGLAEESAPPFSPDAIALRGAGPVFAYRASVWGMIPPLGLVLGPAAFVVGLWSWLRRRGDPEFKGGSLCKAAVLIGILLTLTQWLGLLLMIHGLKGD